MYTRVGVRWARSIYQSRGGVGRARSIYSTWIEVGLGGQAVYTLSGMIGLHAVKQPE